jgi:hypothetical protein
VHYGQNGLVAFHAKAENIAAARTKAAYIKSQGFYEEIKTADGHTVPLHADD